MPTKAFSLEDGNLATKPIVTSQTKTYNDVDLSFKKKTTGDIFKKTDAAAVKQSIKNILLTNRFEKPFSPYFGGDLGRFLFSLDTEFDEEDVRDRVISAVSNFEPRASIRKVNVEIAPDFNSVLVDVVFQIIATEEVDTLTVSLTRLR